MNPFELQKERVLVFCDTPANQLDQAYLLLDGLDHFHVEKGPLPNSLLIRYSVEHYSLEGLEKALHKEGFCFEYGLLGQFKTHVDPLLRGCAIPQSENARAAHQEQFAGSLRESL